MVVVKRALLSCYDTTGLDAFARTLASLGVELIASGGTADFLSTHQCRVTTVEAFTGIPQQLDGRVKTLHPKIHAGILARRDDPSHLQAAGGAQGLIDLVVVNLYPFEDTIGRSGTTMAEAVEQIDVGGVALLRAAAKNFAFVGAVSRPEQYAMVAKALRDGHGQLSDGLAKELAAEAFRLTSAYDTRIAQYLADGHTPGTAEDIRLHLRKRQALRYGENPHQGGTWYVPAETAPWGIGTLKQLQGKELSYNNLLDIDAALRCLLEFSEPTCAIVKHHSQCGVASGTTPQDAYERAYACDAESAFGGVIGVNRPVDRALAGRLAETFLEVVVAPAVDGEALAVFAKKPNVRVVTVAWPSAVPSEPEWRALLGSWLAQEPDRMLLDPETLTTVTTRAPTEHERSDLLFAWACTKHAQSNGIVLARDRATVGIGQGQPSRVGSVRVALEKAAARARGAVAASDGFFPFPDGVELLAKAGVTAVIQPGGSKRDAEVVAAADRAKLAMLMTGIRHFRH